jgi:hypothetical protein
VKTVKLRALLLMSVILSALSVAFVAPVLGQLRIAATGEAAGALMVESDPAGASVYVDGRLAGETPVTLSAIAVGVHRVRVLRLGYLENSRLVTIKPGAPATLRARLTDPAPQIAKAAALKIVVVEGEGAVNIIQQKTAVAPVVEVRHRNDQPVSGAVVRFAIQKGRATFNGARTLTATTDALGRATAAGLAPTGSGPLSIAASATFQGQTAAVAIVQTNVLTAAQAATAATAGTGGAGGGGLSHFAIAAIVGGAGAGIGGALIASKAANGCSGSPVCGAWNVAFASPGLNTSACGSPGPLGFNSQVMDIDAAGNFHGTWGNPVLVQVDSMMTATSLTGNLRCLATAATGTISATPSGGDYLGTATLGGVTVSVRATRFSG